MRRSGRFPPGSRNLSCRRTRSAPCRTAPRCAMRDSPPPTAAASSNPAQKEGSECTADDDDQPTAQSRPPQRDRGERQTGRAGHQVWQAVVPRAPPPLVVHLAHAPVGPERGHRNGEPAGQPARKAVSDLFSDHRASQYTVIQRAGDDSASCAAIPARRRAFLSRPMPGSGIRGNGQRSCRCL